MTGTDLASPFRGCYRSRAEALALAKSYAGKPSLPLLIGKALYERGLGEVPLLSAQRGDILLVKRANARSLGILALNGKEILAASETGYLRLDVSRAIRAWRV